MAANEAAEVAAATAAAAALYTVVDGVYTYTAPDGARFRWDDVAQAWAPVEVAAQERDGAEAGGRRRGRR